MNPDPTAKRRGSVVTYAVSIGLLLLAAVNVAIRSEWYLCAGLAAFGLVGILASSKPLFRTAISRKSVDEVRCRFVPWYRAYSIATSVVLPIIGVMLIAAGQAPDNPALLRYPGYFALLLGIVFALFAVVQTTNRLSFTPTTLVIRIGRRFEMPRERLVSIKPRDLTSVGSGKRTRHYDLVYAPADGESNKVIAALDAQFSVEPANLVAALETWRDTDPTDRRLIDSVEAILRGHRPDGSFGANPGSPHG